MNISGGYVAIPYKHLKLHLVLIFTMTTVEFCVSLAGGVRSMMGKVAALSTLTSGLSDFRVMAGINGVINGMKTLIQMVMA